VFLEAARAEAKKFPQAQNQMTTNQLKFVLISDADGTLKETLT